MKQSWIVPAIFCMFVGCAYLGNYFFDIHKKSYTYLVAEASESVDVFSNDTSLCPTFNKRTNERRVGQYVVSFAFYGPVKHTRKYFQGIEENAKLVKKYYPGWEMRVYHNATKDMESYKLMENLERKYDNLNFCNILNITSVANLSDVFGMVWRFIPIGDPTVDLYLSRDLDSRIHPREIAAVQEWINSNLTFHIMRDHPKHGSRVMGGMWGARVSNNRQLMTNIFNEILSKGTQQKKYGFDQDLLANAVWPHTDGDGIHHDSYHCKDSHLQHRYWKPFPTKRKNGEFVGAIFGRLYKPCPLECRFDPQWTFC